MSVQPAIRVAVAALAGGLLGWAGCSTPCDRLAERVCEEMKDEDACMMWRTKIQKLPKESCQRALEGITALGL